MMETSKILVLVIFWSTAMADANQSDLFPQLAIKSLAKNHFSKLYSSVDIIYFGNVEVEKLMKVLVHGESLDLTFNVINGNHKSWKRRAMRPSFLIMDSHTKFAEIFNSILWYNHPTELYHHLVYSPKLEFSALRGMNRNRMVQTVNFLIRSSSDTIDLVTSYFNTETACRFNLFSEINEFYRKSLSWNNTSFYPDNLRHFHGCPIYVKPSGGMSRQAMEIIDIFIQHVNATKEYCDFNHADLLVSLGDERSQLLGFRFLEQTIHLITPSGEPLTTFEKMLKPFQRETWIAIILTLVCGMISIWVISLFCPKFVQHFIFGRFVTTPSLNFMSGFLIGLQHQVPSRNFARFILTLFSIWCLIIRTCYQSELFKHLQTDHRYEPIKAFNEIAERKFSVFVHLATSEDGQVFALYDDFKTMSHLVNEYGGKR